jgi:hypothetical protein
MPVGKVTMLPLHKEFNGIRKTILTDVDYLAPRLRVEDKREILDSVGLNPYQALANGYNSSEICLTIIDTKDIPVGMFGVGETGIIWLLATPEIHRIRFSFLRESRKVVNLLNHKYKILWNFVDCRNELHLRWLKWCGFKFLRKINYGVNQKPFFEFIKLYV